MGSGRLRHGLLAMLATGLMVAGCADKTSKAMAEAQVAQGLLDAGDLPGARRAMQRALAQRDDQVDLLLLDGRIKYQMNDIGGAYDSYNLALAIDPNSPEALQAVSQLGASIGAERDSTAATDRILTLDPKNMSALLIRGVQSLNKRDFNGALATAERMVAIDPRSEPALVLKARAIFLLGRRDEALALLRDATKRLGPTRMIATALLECARDAGDAALMTAQFRTLRDLVPNNPDLALDEANLDYKTGNRDGARARGWMILAESSKDEDAVRRLIGLWTEYDPAPLDAGQIARVAADGAPAARLLVARYYLERGDTATATVLVGSLPGDAAAGLRLRIADVARDATAPAAAEALLARDRTNCDAVPVRVGAALRGGRPTEAVAAAQVAAAECPDGTGHQLLARAYRARGDDAGTRRAYLEGIRAQSLATPIVAEYVAWLLSEGDGGGAVDVARSLTQRAPAKISAWRLLRLTCERAGRAACAAQAATGEATARRTFSVDLPPGQRRANPLLGNSWR